MRDVTMMGNKRKSASRSATALLIGYGLVCLVVLLILFAKRSVPGEATPRGGDTRPPNNHFYEALLHLERSLLEAEQDVVATQDALARSSALQARVQLLGAGARASSSSSSSSSMTNGGPKARVVTDAPSAQQQRRPLQREEEEALLPSAPPPRAPLTTAPPPRPTIATAEAAATPASASAQSRHNSLRGTAVVQSGGSPPLNPPPLLGCAAIQRYVTRVKKLGKTERSHGQVKKDLWRGTYVDPRGEKNEVLSMRCDRARCGKGVRPMLELWSHRHVVSPVAYCPKTETLVVPFLPKHLPHTVGRDKVASTRNAYWRNGDNWEERLRYAIGIAKSIAGLHAVGRVNCDWLYVPWTHLADCRKQKRCDVHSHCLDSHRRSVASRPHDCAGTTSSGWSTVPGRRC